MPAAKFNFPSKAALKVVEMIDQYVDYFERAKGVKPAEVALTRAQAATLGVKAGQKLRGCRVVVSG